MRVWTAGAGWAAATGSGRILWRWRLGSAALFGALLGALACFLGAVGLAFDGDDLGAVDQTVDEGDNAGGVGEDLAPFGEGTIGGDNRAFLLVAAADQFEQQIGVPIGVGQIAERVDLCGA